MACDPLVFTDFTRDRFNRIGDKVAEFGFSLSADSGEESQKGFTLVWIFDEAAQTLTLQVTDSPFFVPCSTINDRIRQALTTIP